MRLFRTLKDIVFFLAVLTAVLFLMQKFDVIDLGAGNVHVVDGDSLRQGDTNIRLYGIDAPEYRQSCFDKSRIEYACGKQAANTLRGLVKGQQVTCSAIDTDRYSRAVSICKINTLDLNVEMVRQGWAVAYNKHSLNYAGVEAEARRAKRGIWAGTFEEPEDYRARNRHVQGGLGEADVGD